MKRLKGVLEALSQIKHRRTTILVCPRCGKTRILPERSVTLGFLPTVYVCEDCGYRGYLITEADEEDPDKP
jgi:predicted RNA-binding Zn-ribbon protein involved in translation (DUF1610 family)